MSEPKTAQSEFGRAARRRDVKPKVHPLRLLVSLVFGAIGLLVSAWILPGVHVDNFGGALVVAVILGALNAVVPPILAALRLPYTVAFTFLLVLAADAAALLIADAVSDGAVSVDGFFSALVAAVVVSGVTTVLEVVFGVNDDDAYSLSVVNRVARRSGERVETDAPGILYLEIDGLSLPVLQRAMRDGNAPNMARWLADDTHRLIEWETDLSSQTGASQAGILLGSNEDVPAFRWVEKERGRLMVCSNPDDCAEIERRHAGDGLLRNGGASRGNLLSGEADHVLLTASRISAEKKANPGYRAFFANGFNVTRTLVLLFWEVILELVASARQRRRDVRPRGHRGGVYPLIRGGMCVFIRDLTVYAVLADMFTGRPAVYATFASYDEVAHHSGLERPDTLEALRKLDQQFGRLDRARRYAPRPYIIVVLSDHGQTQGATFKQRNGYALEDLVRQSVEASAVHAVAAEDEGRMVVGTAFDEATGQGEESGKKRGPKSDVSGEEVVVLGSGNLGLIYLMDEPRRLTLEEIDKLHPRLIPALREHPHVGFLVVASAADGPVALGARGIRYLADGRVEGEDPLAPFSPTAAQHLLRSAGFANAPDIYVNSFFDPELEEGCAFEELISFHGGMGGPQTRPFLLVPEGLPLPEEPIVGAATVHRLLKGWREQLQPPAPTASPAEEPVGT
ncbi:MAG TPA: phage holin family protein [Gaiellaceae bacterium]